MRNQIICAVSVPVRAPNRNQNAAPAAQRRTTALSSDAAEAAAGLTLDAGGTALFVFVIGIPIAVLLLVGVSATMHYRRQYLRAVATLEKKATEDAVEFRLPPSRPRLTTWPLGRAR